MLTISSPVEAPPVSIAESLKRLELVSVIVTTPDRAPTGSATVPLPNPVTVAATKGTNFWSCRVVGLGAASVDCPLYRCGLSGCIRGVLERALHCSRSAAHGCQSDTGVRRRARLPHRNSVSAIRTSALVSLLGCPGGGDLQARESKALFRCCSRHLVGEVDRFPCSEDCPIPS